MRLDALIGRDCISCPAIDCSCPTTQDCVVTNGDCNTCPKVQCVTKASVSSSSSSGGVSKGALAGAVVGVIIFLAIVIAGVLWYRRIYRLRSAKDGTLEVKDIPVSADTVLSRPDPNAEKHSSVPTERSNIRVYSTSSNTTIDLDPESQVTSANQRSSHSVHSNPFSDTNSIQTAGTEGTNVIPIALVAPDSRPSTGEDSMAPSGPTRPVRSADLNLNLDHTNVSEDSIRPPNNAMSRDSGISNASSSRNSYMSNASYASDFLNEAPMIITPKRQMLGVGKAEFVTADGGLKVPANKPATRSPLAATSFGPESDAVSEDDPFSDKHYSNHATVAPSPAASTTTFGQRSSDMRESGDSQWAETPSVPWARNNSETRPSSMSTQAGSVIGIENATRVNLGLTSLGDSSRPLYRQTMARLVTPESTLLSARSGNLQEQQQKAFVLAQARAQDNRSEESHSNRISGSSVISATSTRADSILESFPFVPPSPISDRPIRSPPVSPLVKQSFTATSPLSQRSFAVARSPTLAEPLTPFKDSDLPAPPDRKTLGLSTGSQLSTASSGLGSFPFQIDSGNNAELANAPSSYNGRQRASLDTLAITSDLSSYPLAYGRDSSVLPPVPHVPRD